MNFGERENLPGIVRPQLLLPARLLLLPAIAPWVVVRLNDPSPGDPCISSS